MTFSYDADGSLFSMNCDGKDYYYILNPTGDVIALVDTGWNTVVSYAYDSWGNVTAIEGDQDLGRKTRSDTVDITGMKRQGCIIWQADIMTRKLDGLLMRMI